MRIGYARFSRAGTRLRLCHFSSIQFLLSRWEFIGGRCPCWLRSRATRPIAG